ncbi:ATP synthase subunit b [Desulfuromonas versatilis]|uniref:ATP synthase subunit b n=1 Tax=Desulfuromonas versatilis TaxID=2802975 RepID=A0ABN6DUS8_9BACT|nr:ATP synthase F0 subunit B [Desulfuromonas versatilis]BCR02951.1 ATP synthase subunit b [Desulfuromonas versatilis]
MIEINWTILLQIANFLVLMAVLNMLLYRPLREVLNRRKQAVEGGHQSARDLEGQIKEKMARYEQQLQEAKAKGAAEKATLRQAAASEEAELVGKAQGQAAEKLEKIKQQVAGEAEQARTTLKIEARSLASDIACKILGRAL